MLDQHHLFHMPLSHPNEIKPKATNFIRTSTSYYTTLRFHHQTFTTAAPTRSRCSHSRYFLRYSVPNATAAIFNFRILRQRYFTEKGTTGHKQHLYRLCQNSIILANMHQTDDKSQHAQSSYWTMPNPPTMSPVISTHSTHKATHSCDQPPVLHQQ